MSPLVSSVFLSRLPWEVRDSKSRATSAKRAEAEASSYYEGPINVQGDNPEQLLPTFIGLQ